MHAPSTYVLGPAMPEDAPALRRLAKLDSAAPLAGPVLLGEIDGTPAAAIALGDGSLVADPFGPTAQLAAHLRTRASGLWAAERTPSLRARLRSRIRIRVAQAA